MRSSDPQSETARDDAPRGDTFLPVELLRLIRATAPRRRLRDRSGLPSDRRRPARPPEPASPSAESWDAGADPMLWTRTRQGERMETGAVSDLGLRPGWLARILGFGHYSG